MRMRVKVFDCGHEKDLEADINKFIESIEEERMEVKDIKFSTSHLDTGYCFSALVMYGPINEIFIDMGGLDEIC